MNVIQIENLSKQYRLGLVNSSTIVADLDRFWAKVRGKEDPALTVGVENRINTLDGEYVWALNNINFEVKKGEVLGIIGKNGAGKSTLLKILSKVTAPTTGCVKIKGRIASLLEVGTGFHPELTGKENIFLNGAILGMTQAEIKRKFDEIVDFSGVGKYIDTPVKRYSSGMYVRLAFAVAAHLEPEILIIDEVLAVGDAEFQKKALGKINDVSKDDGRTVLFVSHNMTNISNLCSRTLLLMNGRVDLDGSTKDVIGKYLRTTIQNVEKNGIKALNIKRDNNYLAQRVIIEDFGIKNDRVLWKEAPVFKFKVRNLDPKIDEIEFGIGISSTYGEPICTFESKNTYKFGTNQILQIQVNFIEPKLVPGNYYASLGIRSNVIPLDYITNFICFEVLDFDTEGKNLGFRQDQTISGHISTDAIEIILEN